MTENNKEEIIQISQQSSLLECCMCGDSGLILELFQCKVCRFRSQHRYCSNLYPKAESYKVCNWCLNQKEDSKEKSQNSSNSNSESRKDHNSNNNNNKNNSEDDDSKNKRKNKVGDNDHEKTGLIKGNQRNNNLKLHLMIKNPIKKSPENSSSPRKRITSNARLEEKLIRRTKSEEISNNGFITRHVFRNKVRRYKLLDEVSS